MPSRITPARCSPCPPSVPGYSFALLPYDAVGRPASPSFAQPGIQQGARARLILPNPTDGPNGYSEDSNCLKSRPLL